MLSQWKQRWELHLEFLEILILNQFIAPYMLLDFPKLFRSLRVLKIEDQVVAGHNLVVIECQDSKKQNIRLTINRDTQHLIDSQDSGVEGFGAAAIGIVLMGLPGIFLSLPVLLPTWIVRVMVERMSGKDWHHLVLWSAIKKQLPSEVANELNKALSR